MSDIDPAAAALIAPVQFGMYSYFCGNFRNNPVKIGELQEKIVQSVKDSTNVNISVLGAQFGEGFGDMTIGNVMFICDVCKDAFEPEPKVITTTLTTILQRMFLNKFDREIATIVNQNRCTYKKYKHMVEKKIQIVRKGAYTCEEVKFFYIEDHVSLSQNNAPGVDIAVQESDNAPWHTNPNIAVVNLDGSSIDPASRDASHHRFRFPPPGIEVVKTKEYLDSIGHVAIEKMIHVFVSGPGDAAGSQLIAEVAKLVRLQDGDCITSITFVDEAQPFVQCKILILVRTTTPGTRGRSSFTHKATIIDGTLDQSDKCVGNPVKNVSQDLILYFVKYFGDEQQCVGEQIFQQVIKLLKVRARVCIFTVDGTVQTRSHAMLNAYFVHNHGKKFKDEAGYEIKYHEFLLKNKSKIKGIVQDAANQISTVNSILCIPEQFTPEVIHQRLIDRIRREYLDQANSVFNSLTKAQLENIIYLGMRGNEHIALMPGSKAYNFITNIKTIIEILIELISNPQMIWPPPGTDYQGMKSYMSAIEIKRIVSSRHSAILLGISASNSEKKLFTTPLLGISTNPETAATYPNLAALEQALISRFGANYSTFIDYAGGFSIALQKYSR